MNRKRIILVGVALLLPLYAQISNAVAVTINDAYTGADDHDYGDVIGNSNYFDISSMNINLIGNTLSVDIYTNFAGRGDDLHSPHILMATKESDTETCF